MIQFSAIRSAIVQGLAAYLGFPVIEMNSPGKIPPYPFLTYDFSTVSADNTGYPAFFYGENVKTQEETVEFTVSFNSYAGDKLGSIENALRARDWFNASGHLVIKDAVNVVVVNVGEVGNRDVQVGDEWERRNGFDVEFRTINSVTTPNEQIETINVREVE